jgi:flagellar hook-basal body complex protein FliE
MQIERVRALLASEAMLQPETEPRPVPGGPSFSQVLNQALSQVEQDQVSAGEAIEALATGEINDIAAVMIASERANLSLGLTIQVRNKLLEAYQEIMRMPL